MMCSRSARWFASIVLSLALVCASAADAAISRVSANHVKSTANPPSLVLPSSVTVGNMVAVFCKNHSTSTANGPKVSDATNGDGKDSLNNTYAKLVDLNETGDGNTISIWIAPITTGGTATITCNLNGQSPDGQVGAAQEYQGFTGTPTFDKSHTGQGTSAGPSDSGSTATTTQANELLLGGHADAFNGNPTAGASYTIIESGGSAAGRFAFEDRIVSATGTYNATFTLANSVAWGAVIATVYDAGGGGGGGATLHEMSLGGVGK